MSKHSLLIGLYLAIGSQLIADPIPILTATSASVMAVDFSEAEVAAGPFFDLTGTLSAYRPMTFSYSPGAQVFAGVDFFGTIFIPFVPGASSSLVSGTVTVEGTISPVRYYGHGTITAPSVFVPVAPPSPPPGTSVVNEIFVVPASLQANLNACTSTASVARRLTWPIHRGRSLAKRCQESLLVVFPNR